MNAGTYQNDSQRTRAPDVAIATFERPRGESAGDGRLSNNAYAISAAAISSKVWT
jgi:hypothetical protein